MRKMIDEEQPPITEFGYTSCQNHIELVKLESNNRLVSLKWVSNSGETTGMDQVYIDDIPKMIIALQSAHNAAIVNRLGVDNA